MQRRGLHLHPLRDCDHGDNSEVVAKRAECAEMFENVEGDELASDLTNVAAA